MKTNDKIRIGGWKKIKPNEVIFLQGESNYTTLYLRNGKSIFVATTLKKLQARFSESGFFRTHKSFLVNLSYLVELHQLEALTINQEIVLENDQIIPLSRRRKRELVAFLAA